MNLKKTNRGFYIAEFKDRTQESCSIQESSVATESCIWLGIDSATPIIMASDARNIGLPLKGHVNGWVPFPLPKEVHISTRMHLTIDNVKELLPLLHRFVDTGGISPVSNNSYYLLSIMKEMKDQIDNLIWENEQLEKEVHGFKESV